MSAINERANPRERRTWWETVLGTCVVCGIPLEHPMRNTVKSLHMRSRVEGVLFHYGCLAEMEAGHLIDRYLLHILQSSVKGETVGKSLSLRVQRGWGEGARKGLESRMRTAYKTTVPVCKECNLAMTKPQSEALVTLYSVMRPEWFKGGRVPIDVLYAQNSRKADSIAKKLEAVFTFFMLLPAPPGAGGEAVGDEVDHDEGGAEEDGDGDGVPGPATTLSRGEQAKRGQKGLTREDLEVNSAAMNKFQNVQQFFSPESQKKTVQLDGDRVRVVSVAGVRSDATIVVRSDTKEVLLRQHGEGEEGVGEEGTEVVVSLPNVLRRVLKGQTTLSELRAGASFGHTGVREPDAAFAPVDGDDAFDAAMSRVTQETAEASLLGDEAPRGRPRAPAPAPEAGAGAASGAGDAPAAPAAGAGDGEGGAPQPAAEAGARDGLVWHLKHPEDMWMDFSLLKTVSHLMQWGATFDSRHRALAIFWSGHYLWFLGCTAEQLKGMPFHVWYAHVFRLYYLFTFPRSTWFSHDALTMGQLTNAYRDVGLEPDAEQAGTGWVSWVREQLRLLRPEMVAVNAFVFGGDSTQLRYAELAEHLVRKDVITDTIELVRSHASNTAGVFELLFSARGADGLDDYLGWFLFVMSSETNAYEYVWLMRAELGRIVRGRLRKGKDQAPADTGAGAGEFDAADEETA